jgi:outer membrane lipoprotein SlyB
VKNVHLATLVVLPLLSACATDPYGKPNIGGRLIGGALIGAAAGAVGGSAIGVDPITGAAAGMVAGGAIGAASTARVGHGRKYYKDTRGYCYYVDASGQPRYDPAVTC